MRPDGRAARAREAIGCKMGAAGRLRPFHLAAVPLLLVGLAACPHLESPDARAREAVAQAAEAGLSLELEQGGVTLEIPPGRLEATSVTTAPLEEGRLRAFARVSLEGRLEGIPVSYVGDERFVVRCAASCELVGPPAPRLLELLGVLRARREALQAGDREQLAGLSVPEARQRLARADLGPSASRGVGGWFIRIDRDEALVGEAAPAGGQRQLILRLGEDGWRFVSGLP